MPNVGGYDLSYKTLYDPTKAPLVGGLIGSALGTAPATQVDTSPIANAQTSAFGLQQGLDAQRQLLQPQQQQLYQQGQGAIAGLQDAASGAVPSAAEQQLRAQGSRDASNSFGIAAALQGRSPGMALKNAIQGATQTQATTNQQAGVQRANEQATARGQLVGAIQGQQGNTTAQGGQLLGGESNALGTGTTAANDLVGGNTTNAAAQNQAAAGALGIVGNVASAYLGNKSSDERMKKDIEPAGDKLMALAKALEPFTYRYKNPSAPGASPGEQLGPMAQDVQKAGPIGRGMVRQMPDGSKGLDLGSMIGAALSLSAEALKRTQRKAA